MSVGLLVITHDNVGRALLESAHVALADAPLPADLISASRDCDPEALLEQARSSVTRLDRGEGVLVLTDLYGATPSNIAARLLKTANVRVVTGMNLPMLIRVFNYPTLGLDALAAKAVSGGIDGVLLLPAGAQEP